MISRQFVYRPLIERVKNCPRKVAIIEGARAVGKTSMVRHELASGDRPLYSYETFSDAETFRVASAHIDGWVSSLRLPCIIDEAQRIPGVLLAVKNRIDSLPQRNHPLIILTGSAGLSRSSLNGQDPLTRRSLRYTLYPLTQRELSGQSGTSVVDLLWSGTPNEDYRSHSDHAQISRFMERGGFPGYAVNLEPLSEADFRLSLQSDIDSVLGDTILPGERLDRTIAEHILTELLVAPSNILNVKRVADTINSQPITVDRYISIFMRRFLVGALKNLRSAPGKQPFTRAKIRPLDTSFSVEALKQAGRDFMENRVLFGEVFESFVSNQIIPEIEWSRAHPDAFYWRDVRNNPKEVDLVLVRDNQVVGIEVKSSQRSREEDFSGLYALRKWCEKKGEVFRRGYVINTGASVERYSPTMWVLPVSALWDPSGFARTHRGGQSHASSLNSVSENNGVQATRRDNSGEVTAARVFLSYNHADNDFLDGKIITLLKDVADRYEFETSQRLAVFIDRDTLAWRSEWKQEIDKNIGIPTFILPAITPRYVHSDRCRKELLELNARVAENKPIRIIPLLVQNIDQLKKSNPEDPLLPIIETPQHPVRFPDLTLISRRDYERLVARITHRLESDVGSVLTTPRTERASFDVLESGESLRRAVDLLEPAVRQFKQAFQRLTRAVSKIGPTSSFRSLEDVSGKAQTSPDEVQHAAALLEQREKEMGEKWRETYPELSRYAHRASHQQPQKQGHADRERRALFFLDRLEALLQMPAFAVEAVSQVREKSELTVPLRSLTAKLVTALSNIDTMRMMVRVLRESRRKTPEQRSE